MTKYYYEDDDLQEQTVQETYAEQFGCGFCYDKRKKQDKELFFLDAANNMRICDFCPSCGRKLGV